MVSMGRRMSTSWCVSGLSLGCTVLLTIALFSPFFFYIVRLHHLSGHSPFCKLAHYIHPILVSATATYTCTIRSRARPLPSSLPSILSSIHYTPSILYDASRLMHRIPARPIPRPRLPRHTATPRMLSSTYLPHTVSRPHFVVPSRMPRPPDDARCSRGAGRRAVRTSACIFARSHRRIALALLCAVHTCEYRRPALPVRTARPRADPHRPEPSAAHAEPACPPRVLRCAHRPRACLSPFRLGAQRRTRLARARAAPGRHGAPRFLSRARRSVHHMAGSWCARPARPDTRRAGGSPGEWAAHTWKEAAGHAAPIDGPRSQGAGADDGLGTWFLMLARIRRALES